MLVWNKKKKKIKSRNTNANIKSKRKSIDVYLQKIKHKSIQMLPIKRF